MATATVPPADGRQSGEAKTWRAGTLVYTTAGLVALFFWLLVGDFAWQLKERSVTVTAQLVLKKFGSSNFFAGLLIGSIPSAIGMILAPIVGVRSDRHRGRWGRRLPFLLVPLPFVVASMAGLAFAPAIGSLVHDVLGAGSPGHSTCVLAVFAVFWCAFELFSTVTNTVVGGLINDVVPREVLGRFFAMWRMVSLIDGIIFGFLIMKHAEEYFFWVFIGTGLVYGVGFTLMCLNVREGEYPPPEPIPEGTGAARFAQVRGYLRECFTTPFYLWIFTATILCHFSFQPINAFNVFYAKHLDMDMGLYGTLVAISYSVSLLFAYPIGILADRFHPLRLGIGAMIAYLLVAVGGTIWGVTTQGFAAAFLAHNIISGFYFTSMASVGQRLYPKLKFAQFLSAAMLVQGAAGMILPATVGAILDLSGRNYRLTFLMGGCLAGLGLFALVQVYREFQRLGGMSGYRPPGSSDESTAP
jgi:maltose/moltooligosaccharide transporter